MLVNDDNVTITQLHKILLSDVDTTDCQYCLNRINKYVTSQLAGEDYRSVYAETAVHLDSCPNCAAAYARLYELEFTTAQDTLPEPTHLSAPDMSFLQTAVVTDHDLITKVKSAVQEIGDKFYVSLSAELVSLLRPLPNATPVLRSSGEERYAEIFFQLNPAELPQNELPFTITAFRDAQHIDSCLVEVRVQPPAQSWPALGGKKVNIKMPTETIAGTTDAWGLAVFNNVRITNLATATIEVSV